ncbi:MAG TPA: tetratricopeptide repeat protein, partial [Chthoniobacteraceae bacterium]
NNLGNALHQRGKLKEAIDAYRHAIEIKPDYTNAYSNLGNALQAGGKIDEAIEACLRALELDVHCVPALNNLGNCYKDRGQLDLAIDHYRKAVLKDPSSAGRHSNLVYCIHFHSDYDARRILAECLEWERAHALPLRKCIAPHGNERSVDRRLRIGYLSPDFCNHVVGWNLFPLLQMRDREALEIFAYSDTLRVDGFTEQIRAQCDHWREIVGFSDEKVAETIRADRIDILVDLTLHMAQNRLLVFARKPAPVQVTYLGYCGTTGLGAIDYRMSDPYLDPPESDLTCYRETTVRLPRSYWCYRPGGATPDPGPAPASKGQPMIFGCLNNFAKVSVETLELWIEILRDVPHSRLLLNAQPGPCREAAWEKMRKAGLSTDRLEFVERGKWERYIENLQKIDLALDPFPYGGGISTCDALWMGIPVVSLSGRTAVGRGGRSILTNVGLPELVAETPAQYLEIAVSLARDLPRLSELHSTLRERMECSPLRDARGFARDFEAAFREMWRKWCTEGSSP